ncbi:MAG: GIY-YIG nuclease family protein [Pseudomonas sp.]|jgi:putative endonuclease|nr:GIY-YIG nuclease family protein [Pseudomonas sp.]
MEKLPAVYILTNKTNGTLYIGVTSDLISRVWQHKQDCVAGFTRRYSIHQLVYYELYDTMEVAIQREKQLKAGSRQKKIDLIERLNPNWLDLYQGLL